MTDTNWGILSGFLRSPLERRRFDAFFALTYRQTLAYLRHLRFRGYRLPLDARTDSDALADLAVDLLGEIAATRDNLLFPDLFEFLKGHCNADFPESERDRIESLFTAFLTVQIRQRLSRLKLERDPQTENLKRRIKDILKQPPFIMFSAGAASETLIRLDEGDYNHDQNKLIPIGELRHLVEIAFLHSNSRTSWCHDLFRLLKELTSYSLCVRLSDLLTLMVGVNAGFIEGNARCADPFPNPQSALFRKRAELARQSAIASAHSEITDRFVSSGRLTVEEGTFFYHALARYMEDFSSSGETDPIPTYFRESMPPETHSRYLRDYKYVFETVLYGGRDRFIAILREDPTIRELGGYIHIDGEKKGSGCTSDE